MNGTWFLDEASRAGSEHLDAAYVSAYDRKAAFDAAEDVSLLRDLGLGGDSTLVDLGAGTGTLALAAAPHCGRVIAVDVSPAMVAALRAKVGELDLRNVVCIQAGFLTYTHRHAAADVVYSRNALHHLPDFWKAIALERIGSILRQRGVFFLRDLVFAFDPDEAEHQIEDWLAHAVENPRAGWTRAELETHVREEYSTFTWLLEPMLRKAGFEIEAVEHRRRVYASYVCRRIA